MLRLLATCILPLAGCASARPLAVNVRDADSLRPVGGAIVIANAQDPIHPLDLAGQFSAARGPEVHRLTTDESGVATARIGPRKAVRLLVLAPGYQPVSLFLDPPPGALRVNLKAGSTEGGAKFRPSSP